MYIQIDGNPAVLNALHHLIPQLEHALSPWNIKVIDVIDVKVLAKELAMAKAIDVIDDTHDVNHVNHVNDIDVINDDEIEWEEVEDKHLEPLQRRFLSMKTYGLQDGGVERRNSVKNISVLKASDTSYAIEVKMEHEMSPEQVKSFVKFVCKDEPYKVFPGYKLISSPDISSKKTEDKRFFVITIKYDTVKYETHSIDIPSPTHSIPTVSKVRRIIL
jgi:hypothetical protein